MVRRAHLVRQLPEKAAYDGVLCVQCAVRPVYQSEADDTGELKVAGFALRLIDVAAGKRNGVVDATGRTKAAFWRLVKLHSEGRKRVLLVSLSAREQAAALGLWDLVTEGVVTLADADPYCLDKNEAVAKRRYDGYAVLEGPPTIIVFRFDGSDTSFTWVDPANYGCGDPRESAAATAHASEKGKTWAAEPWFDLDTLDVQVSAVSNWVVDYRDALASLGLGNMENTAASQAAVGYRKTAMEYAIVVHDNPAVCRLERQALHGGRCECRLIGTVYRDEPLPPVRDEDDRPRAVVGNVGPIYHVDVNSLYPAVAGAAMLPCKLLTVCRNVPVDTLLSACKATTVIADVALTVDAPVVPMIHEGLTIFPVGSFRTQLCGPELLLAARHGKIHSCHMLACYEARPIYRDWVARLYNARLIASEAGRKGIARCIKAILNSSFGKWAQRRRQWVDCPGEVCHLPFYQWWQRTADGERLEQWRSFAWLVQRMTTGCETCHGFGTVAGKTCQECGGFDAETGESFPAITAYINSLGRVYLWNLMQTAGMANVYYYDTDSLWVNGEGLSNLYRDNWLNATALGMLKTVGEHSQVTFYGIKRYTSDGTLTMAGCNCDSITHGDAFALQWRSPPTGFYLRKRQAPGLDRHVSRVKLAVPYKLGRVQPDGSVQPFRIS